LVKDGRLHFLALDLLDAKRRELDRVVTWVQADCRFHELMKLPPAEIAASVTEQREMGGEMLYGVSVHNTSSLPAAQVWLEVIRGDLGDEVLPAFWSDNALTLLPGERRKVTVRFRAGLLAAATPRLMVEGWNVVPREWKIDGGQPVSMAMTVTSCEVRREAKNVKVHFTATQQGANGPRWTTWSTPVNVDGKVVRYVRLGLRSGATSSALLTLDELPAGEHRIAVGDGPARTVTLP
jgi:hypothetical protein